MGITYAMIKEFISALIPGIMKCRSLQHYVSATVVYLGYVFDAEQIHGARGVGRAEITSLYRWGYNSKARNSCKSVLMPKIGKQKLENRAEVA